jgi:hypothetical protein
MNQAVRTQCTLHCGFPRAVVYTILLLCVLDKTNELAILVHEVVTYLCLLIVTLKSCLFKACEWILGVPGIVFCIRLPFS